MLKTQQPRPASVAALTAGEVDGAGEISLSPSLTTSPAVVEPAPFYLDDAARLILAKFTPHIQSFVEELGAVHLRIPVWAVMAGAVMAAYEQGTLAAPVFDPSWRESLASVTGADPSNAEYTCEYCHIQYPPRRYRQRFCSNECGQAAVAPPHAPTLTRS